MRINQLIQWKPDFILSPKYYITDIVDDFKIFTVTLTDSLNPEIQILAEFKALMFSYKTTMLSSRTLTLKNLAQNHGNSFATEWTFFKLLNSTYAKQLSAESFGFIEFEELIHHVFIADNIIAEFITYEDPVFNFIKSNQNQEN